jgi:hypothetical protein
MGDDKGSDQRAKAKLSEDTLERAIWDSNEILVSASTVLRFQKDTLTLNRAKLFAEKRSGLGGVNEMSVQVEDLLNINGAVGPFFGSLKIVTKYTKPDEPYDIGLFLRKDVINLKRIIQGLIIAMQRRIDLSPIPTDELKVMLFELGEDDYKVH